MVVKALMYRNYLTVDRVTEDIECQMREHDFGMRQGVRNAARSQLVKRGNDRNVKYGT